MACIQQDLLVRLTQRIKRIFNLLYICNAMQIAQQQWQ